MARRFHRHRASHPIADLNVTNLIDLGFMLLIIFMLVASPTIQKEQTVPVNLPTVTKVPEPKNDPSEKFVAAGVDAKGEFNINDRKVTMRELRVELKKLAAQAKQPVIRIRGDGGVQWQKVAELMAEVQAAGLTKFTVDSQSAD